MSSSQGNFSKTLGVQRWIYHKHHGDPFNIEQSSTKYSNNYKSIGGETQKLFFESFTPRNGAGEQLNYRPGSSKNEILIRRKAGLSRPQTATNLKKIKKINLNTEDDSDQEILRKTKKINRIQKEKNDTKQQNISEQKTVKEFIPLDQINYNLIDDREKHDKINIEVCAQDLSKKHTTQELNPVFKFIFDYNIFFQNDSNNQNKIIFQLDQQEIFSIFKDMKANLPANGNISMCNCKEEYKDVLDRAYDQVEKQNDQILQLTNQNTLLNDEISDLKMKNKNYQIQADKRKELRFKELEWEKIVEQKDLKIQQIQRENQTLLETMEKWREEQKQTEDEKPKFQSDNDVINDLNDRLEHFLLKYKEMEKQLEHLKIYYSEKAQPECSNTYEELEEMSDKLMMIMRDQDNIDKLIGEYNAKQDNKFQEVGQKVGDTQQLQLILNNQIEQMTRKCRNKLEEIKKGPQSNDELVAILECNIEINERIKEVGYLLKKKKNEQKVVIEKRQFSKFVMNDDENTIKILPDQKVTGTACQTEAVKTFDAGMQTFIELDEDQQTAQSSVNEFFIYFKFLKTLCAKSGSAEANQAYNYFSVIAEKMEKIRQELQMKDLRLDSIKYRADKLERDVKELTDKNERYKNQYKKLQTDLNDEIMQKDQKLFEINQEYKTLKKEFMYKLDQEKKKNEKELHHQITTLKNDNDDKSHRIAKLTVDSQRKINELEQQVKKLEDDIYQLNQLLEERNLSLDLKNKETQDLEKTYLDRIVQIENEMLKQKYNYHKKVIKIEENIIHESKQNSQAQSKQEIQYVENCINCKSSTLLDSKRQVEKIIKTQDGQKNIDQFQREIVQCSGEIASIQKKYSKLKFQMECWNKLSTHNELLAQSSIQIDRHYQFSQHKQEFDKNAYLVINFKLEGVKNLFNTKCVLLNQMSMVEEVIEASYNESKCKAIYHSGFDKEKIAQNQCYDHFIRVDLSKLPSYIKALGIMGNTEKHLLEFKSGFVQIYENDKPKYHQDFKDFTKSNTVLMLFIYRDQNGNFQTKKCSKFVRIRNLNNTFLSKFLSEQYASAECYGTFDKEQANWEPSSNQTYQLVKDMLFPIPKCAYKNFVVGLGWNSKIDIDSSVLMLDRNYNEYDTVFFGNLKSKDGSVIHRGDSREGNEDSQEDEMINISIQQINQAVHSIFIFISVYTEGKTFEDVSDIYCNFQLNEYPKHFAHYEIEQSYKSSKGTACVLMELFRISNSLWAIRPSNYFLKDIRNAKEALPVIKEILNHDYTQVL